MRRHRLLSSALLIALSMLTPAHAAEPPSHDEARAFLHSLFVASPYRLNAIALSGEIRYRLASSASPTWQPPRTGEQSVWIDDAGLHVAICADCGDEPAPSADMLRHYLSPNAWVRSDDRDIRSFARQHGRGRSVRTRMEGLTEAVRAHMNGPIDYRRYDDATTALQNRSGDCTEFAVLLAAVARARGIPTRIVHGIAYSGRFAGRAHVFSRMPGCRPGTARAGPATTPASARSARGTSCWRSATATLPRCAASTAPRASCASSTPRRSGATATPRRSESSV